MEMKVSIIPTTKYVKEDGTFDKDAAIKQCGNIAGICYAKNGYKKVEEEKDESIERRVDLTINNGHHSVYDHVFITLYLKNVPKIFNMVLNNEKQYTTSERSLRYTPIKDDGSISEDEVILYNKWLEKLEPIISEKYSYIYNESKVNKLAQENARYMVTTFIPTEMVHTLSLRQINYIASWMKDYITNCDKSKLFDIRLAKSFAKFIDELDKLNVLDERLMNNEKHRSLSLFGKDLDKKVEYFGNVYSTNYKSSFAELAQGHRHRTLHYQMELTDDKEYFVPLIIRNNTELVSEWLEDIKSVKDANPQGELVLINEEGTYENFILKCKERLCSAAQLEIMLETRNLLLKYQKALEESNHYLKDDIKNYTKGARCTFLDFECTEDCKFNEGKVLKRTI